MMRLYPRLALDGIRKNRRLYIPYILTCIGMVMMYYILEFLSNSPLLEQMRGGGTVSIVLILGKFVITVFSALFLLYTNAFLIRRRNMEFGLYNILGMDKRSIGRVIVWESLFVSVLGLAGGLVCGIAFSKFAELGLLKATHARIDYRFRVSPASIGTTAILFAIIFLLLTLKSLWQVHRTKPLELMRSENLGEKPPKANWLLALAGLILLGIAYWMALVKGNPIEALVYFFVAVILVIIATYLLFTAGSVALCRLLQRNSRYYYQKNHFISVSSMKYRMKRNGAGLASICILSTIVLVMISSTSSLFLGAEDALNTRYPRSCEIGIHLDSFEELSEEHIDALRSSYEQVFADYGVTPQNLLEYRYASIVGMDAGPEVNLDSRAVDMATDYSRLRQMVFISAADYNGVAGTDLTLEPGTALICPIRCTYNRDRLTMGGMTLDIVGTAELCFDVSEISTSILPGIGLVVPDYETLEPLAGLADYRGEPMLGIRWYYGYDLDAPDEVQAAVLRAQSNALQHTFVNKGSGLSYYYGCRAEEKEDFYATFGGLFFLGILLSLVFIFAAVLIIYYKQISEGYEDQSRFAIMQKVGMTGSDIKKSINSQVLTVFFAPLLFAGLHLIFAFPMVWSLLQLFNLRNIVPVIAANVCSFGLFGLFYAFVYKATAHSYYSIVSGGKKA